MRLALKQPIYYKKKPKTTKTTIIQFAHIEMVDTPLTFTNLCLIFQFLPNQNEFKLNASYNMVNDEIRWRLLRIFLKSFNEIHVKKKYSILYQYFVQNTNRIFYYKKKKLFLDDFLLIFFSVISSPPKNRFENWSIDYLRFRLFR